MKKFFAVMLSLMLTVQMCIRDRSYTLSTVFIKVFCGNLCHFFINGAVMPLVVTACKLNSDSLKGIGNYNGRLILGLGCLINSLAERNDAVSYTHLSEM